MQKVILTIFLHTLVFKHLFAEPLKTDEALSQAYRRETIKYETKKTYQKVGKEQVTNLKTLMCMLQDLV